MSEDTLQRVVECLAATTRYPERLLQPEADLEADLGIDSVKLVEIVLALSEEFGVELRNEQRDPSVRTIRDVADWVDKMRDGESSAGRETSDAGPPSEPPRESSNSDGLSNGVGHTRVAFDPAHRPANGSPHARFGERLRNHAAQNGVVEHAGARPLAGRVALVTGSGRGVGKTIARVLAKRGATVVVNSFHSREQGDATAEEIRAGGGEAVHLWGSVANADHVDGLFHRIDAEFGGLDILVCNASDGRIGPFLELKPDDWDRAFRTNIAGHHRCAVHAAPMMRARGGGAIVTLSAVGAHGYIDGLGAQGVVKAAVETMTRYLAGELGADGVRVNCVAGGPVYGDLLDKFPDARATQSYWESITPDGRLSSAVELAEAVAFLVSDAARGVNGAVWMVDHGFSANADGQRRRRVAPVVSAAAPTVS